MSHKINIEELENSKTGSLNHKFDEKIEGINSVGSIKADLVIKSLGEIIEVTGNIKGKVKLECDVCLKEFELDLDYDMEEYLAKETMLDEYGQETELKEGQFIIDLEGAENIDIYDLLYQSVILNLPNKKVCGINCKGNDFLEQENWTDPRLDVFKNIKIDKKD